MSSAGTLLVNVNSLDLQCNVTGSGNIEFQCSTPACDIVLGEIGNHYSSMTSFHVSNDEFSRLQTTGELTFGSVSPMVNMSDIWIDGLSTSLNVSVLTVATARGSVHFMNTSSSIEMSSANSSVTFSTAKNVTIDSHTTFNQNGAGASVILASDVDCSAKEGDRSDSYFIISNSASLLLGGEGDISVSAPSVDIGGTMNVTTSRLLNFEGKGVDHM